MQLVSFVTVKQRSHGDGLIQIKEPNRPMCSSKIIPRGRILLGPNFKAAEFGGLSICSKLAQTAASGSSKNYSEAHPPDVRGQNTRENAASAVVRQPHQYVLFSLKLVGRWRTRSLRCDQWQSESTVARCRCKPLAGRNAGRLGYHSTSAASCRYLQCGCTQQTVALFLVWRKSVRHFQIIFSSLSGNKFIVIRIIFSFIGPDAFARGLVRFTRNPVPDLV